MLDTDEFSKVDYSYATANAAHQPMTGVSSLDGKSRVYLPHHATDSQRDHHTNLTPQTVAFGKAVSPTVPVTWKAKRQPMLIKNRQQSKNLVSIKSLAQER